MLDGEGEGSQLSWQVHCLRETRWGEWLGQVPPPSLVPLVLPPDFQGARSGPPLHSLLPFYPSYTARSHFPLCPSWRVGRWLYVNRVFCLLKEGR